MRAMPFRTADASAVTLAEPTLFMGSRSFTPADPVVGWDYLTETSIVTSICVDEGRLLASVGLDDLSQVEAFLQVDCPATGERFLETSKLQAGGSSARIQVRLPAARIAKFLEVRSGLLLAVAVPEDLERMSASRRGSRLWADDRHFTFRLEGDEPAFPVESFDFKPAGYPPEAAWLLNVNCNSLHESYAGSVRLYVNSAHPSSAELLSGDRTEAQSVLVHGVFVDLLHCVEEIWEDDDELFESGTVGGVVGELSEVYLSMNLRAAVAALRADRIALVTRAQAGTGFLRSAQ